MFRDLEAKRIERRLVRERYSGNPLLRSKGCHSDLVPGVSLAGYQKPLPSPLMLTR